MKRQGFAAARSARLPVRCQSRLALLGPLLSSASASHPPPFLAPSLYKQLSSLPNGPHQDHPSPNNTPSHPGRTFVEKQGTGRREISPKNEPNIVLAESGTTLVTENRNNPEKVSLTDAQEVPNIVLPKSGRTLVRQFFKPPKPMKMPGYTFRHAYDRLMKHLASNEKQLSKIMHNDQKRRYGKTVFTVFFEQIRFARRALLFKCDARETLEQALLNASRFRSLFNALIQVLALSTHIHFSFKAKNAMKKDGVFPNASTYTILFNAILNVALAENKRKSKSANVDLNGPQISGPRMSRCYSLYIGAIEPLWKDALPETFGPDAGPVLDVYQLLVQLERNDLSYPKRRALESRYSSLLEIRKYPQVLLSTLNCYLNLLGYAEDHRRKWELFQRLCPNPVDRPLETILSDSVSYTTMLRHSRIPADNKDIQVRNKYEKEIRTIWKRWDDRVDIAVKSLSTPASASEAAALKRNMKKQSSSKLDAQFTAFLGEHSVPPIIDQRGLNTLIFKSFFFKDSGLVFLVPILEKYLGLSASDTSGISHKPNEVSPPSEKPIMRLTSPDLAATVLRHFLKNSELGLTYFNQIWAISTDYGRSPVPDMPFGPLIDEEVAASAINWLARHHDPEGCCILLEEMHRAVAVRTSDLKWLPNDKTYAEVMRSISESLSGTASGHTKIAIQEGKFKPWSLAMILMDQFFKSRHGARAKKNNLTAYKLSDDGKFQDGHKLQDDHELQDDDRFQVDQKSQDDHPKRKMSDVNDRSYSFLLRSFIKVARVSGPKADIDAAVGQVREALDLLDSHVGLERGGVNIIERVPLRLPETNMFGEQKSSFATSFLERLSDAFFLSDGMARCAALALNTGTKGANLAPSEKVKKWKELYNHMHKIREECANIFREAESDDKGAKMEGPLGRTLKYVQRYREEQWLKHGGGPSRNNKSERSMRLKLSADDLRTLSKEEDDVEEEMETKTKTKTKTEKEEKEEVGYHSNRAKLRDGRRSKVIERELQRWLKG